MPVFLHGAFTRSAGDVAQPEDWRLGGVGGASGEVGQSLGSELFLTPLQSGLTSTDPGCTCSCVCRLTQDLLHSYISTVKLSCVSIPFEILSSLFSSVCADLPLGCRLQHLLSSTPCSFCFFGFPETLRLCPNCTGAALSLSGTIAGRDC